MKRRDFVWCGAALLALGAAPLLPVPARRPPLLTSPEAWVGEVFAVDSRVIELVAVEGVARDAYSQQQRLHFRLVSGPAITDGTYAMCVDDRVEPLFLQPSREGAVACINRLVAAT